MNEKNLKFKQFEVMYAEDPISIDLIDDKIIAKTSIKLSEDSEEYILWITKENNNFIWGYVIDEKEAQYVGVKYDR